MGVNASTRTALLDRSPRPQPLPIKGRGAWSLLRLTPLLPLLALALLAACANASGTATERGAAALESGDVRTARVELMNALQADPNDRAARILHARVQLALGDGVAAESELMRARRSGVPEAETRHLLAHAKLLQGDARAALAEAADVPPQHAPYAARIRGQAYMALGDGASATVEFNRALEIAPQDSHVWSDIGRFRRSNGDIAGAIQAADRAVAARGDNVEALILRGELTRGQYGLAAALPWFSRALEVDSGNVNALLERARTYGDLGRMTEMLADVREVHRLTGGNATGYFLQAILAARARNYALARSVYNRTNGAFAGTPAGMLLESAIDFGTGNVEQAAGRLAALVERQPGNRKARRLLAAALYRMGDSTRAAETLRPIVDQPDADAYSLALMGRALARLGDGAGASFYLARAAQPQPAALASIQALDEGAFARLYQQAEAAPGDGPVQVRLISALIARGAGDEALERARRLQADNPGAPEVHMLVGDALGMQGDFAAAAENYRRAANIAFSEPVALRLIEALQRSGQAETAGNVLELFVRQNPRNVPGLILLASRRMQASDWPAAINIYESLRARLGNGDATILNNLAWAYSELGDYDRAVPLARRAWSLDRDNPATADTFGWILFKSGRNRAQAMALLEQAARGAPSDAAIRQRLERARRG